MTWKGGKFFSFCQLLDGKQSYWRGWSPHVGATLEILIKSNGYPVWKTWRRWFTWPSCFQMTKTMTSCRLPSEKGVCLKRRTLLVRCKFYPFTVGPYSNILTVVSLENTSIPLEGQGNLLILSFISLHIGTTIRKASLELETFWKTDATLPFKDTFLRYEIRLILKEYE